MKNVRGKSVLVVGLARTGLAVARCLCQRGATVTVTDLRHPQLFSREIPELLDMKIGMELGLHREETFLCHDLIVVSPGVPADLPVLNLARQKGIPVVPEIEVASWLLKGRITGITGTNGKTTTTALLGKILEASGFTPFVGGNIGVPLLSALDQIPPPDLVVSELSSFQLETIQSFRPHVAVLLNLSPNHLDRHADFETYVAAKAQIFRNQTEEDCAVLNADDARIVSLATGIRSRKIYFSRRRELPNGIFVSGEKVRYRVRSLEVALMDVRDVRLRGRFNLENVLAAAAAACVLGAEFASIGRAVRDFSGVEHRLEFVREIQGVAFYNDSKATSVDAAAKALSTFERGVHLILGGKDKGAPYAPLRNLFKDRVREVLVIGVARGRIGRELAGAADIVEAVDLENAVRTAFERAKAGDTILLAPACASFDQFKDFEHRGRVFKALVESLAMGKARKDPGQGAQTGRRSQVDKVLAVRPGSSELDSCERQFTFSKPQEPARQEEVNRPGLVHFPTEQDTSRLSTPRALEYIYEVNAEEAPPGSGFSFEDAINEMTLDPGVLAPTEDVDDEVLAFEIRSSLGDKVAGRQDHCDGSVRVGSGKSTSNRRME